MTYMHDVYDQAQTRKPKMTWTRIHKWGGIAIFGLACFGAGNSVSTGYFQIERLWQKANTLEHVERTTIPSLKAAIPRGTAGKTEHASDRPNCVTVTPPATPLPKPSP